MNQKNASSIVYIIFFLVALLAFSAFAVDGTIVLTNRAKLQNAAEMTALSAASEFNNYSSSATAADITTQVTKTAQETFSLLQPDSLQTAAITVNVKTNEKRVLIIAKMVSQPFFLSFLGITGINLEAKACAQSTPLSVKANYGTNINWLTASAAYLSDILSETSNLNDTAILLPLGDFKSASYNNNIINFGLINSGTDNQPLSLGPGGFVTIKLPAPIIDKPGPDLYIKEAGALEGYFVFVGLDNNPDKPYVQHDMNTADSVNTEGEGISWINISCSGVPENQDSDHLIGAYNVPTTGNLESQDKFYGSGSFDIGARCITGTEYDISMAKYLRIIDDNDESAFVTSDQNPNIYYKAMLYGESSTATPGADIDNVSVLNHIKLISPSDY